MTTQSREWDVRIQRKTSDCIDGIKYVPPEGYDRRELERLLGSMGFAELPCSGPGWELWITTSRHSKHGSIPETCIEHVLVLGFPEDYGVGQCMSLLEEKGFTRTDNRQDWELGPLGSEA